MKGGRSSKGLFGALLAGLVLAAFRLDEPPPEPVALEVRPEDSVAPLVHAPETALVTPAAGAPIVIAPGGSFWVGMVLRIPLTPPPGVQQERALNDFSATATGFADLGARPMVPLPITKIRPEGQSTGYRAVVEVPGWMPEGVYDLQVEGRGFDHQAARGLVVRRGPVGVVTMTASELRERGRAAALSGALVALVPAGVATEPPADAAQEGLLQALSGVGLATVVRPSAADRADGGESFRRRVGPLAFRGPAVSPGAWTERESRRDITVADVALSGGVLENRGRAPARVVVRATSAGPSRLEVDGHRTLPDAVEIAGTFDKPIVVRTYRLDVAGGARLRLALVPALPPASTAPLALELPGRVDVGDDVTLRTREAGPHPSASAWSFGDETFGAGERVRHRFTRLGRQNIELLRVGPDGSLARGRGRVRVETAVRSGCSSTGGAPSSVPILPGAVLLWLISGARRGNSARGHNVAGPTGSEKSG